MDENVCCNTTNIYLNKSCKEVLGRQRFFVCLEIQYELLDSPLTLFLQICKYHKSAYDSLSMHNRHRLESGVVHFIP